MKKVMNKGVNIYGINQRYDDFDNAGLIILKASKVKHEDLGNDHYKYSITTWDGNDVNGNIIQLIANTIILGDKEKAMRVKNAIVELLENFNAYYMMGMLEIAPGVNGRASSQEKLDYAWKSYFAPMYRNDICKTHGIY